MESINKGIKDLTKGVMDFLKDPEQFTKIIGIIIKIVLIIIVSRLIIKVINKIIDGFFERQTRSKHNVDIYRMKTLETLTKSIVKYVVYFISFTAIIKFFGVDVTGLIATAGIGGLALGFGAQNLVRDIITGFFILFEEQFGVGSYVEIGGISGIVEETALRVTKIRGFNGDLHIIPNGEISKVTNKSGDRMRALVEISITYEEDIDNAINILNKAGQHLKEEYEQIVEGPTVQGVARLEDTGVVISVVAYTKSMEQWYIERLMRKTFKGAFDSAGIKMPYEKKIVMRNH